MRRNRLCTQKRWGVALAAVLLLASATAPAQTLAQAVEARTSGNAEDLQSQRRIDALSEETDKMLAEYRTRLKQIDAFEINALM